MKLLTATLLASTLLAAPALAQSNPAPAPAAPAAQSQSKPMADPAKPSGAMKSDTSTTSNAATAPSAMKNPATAASTTTAANTNSQMAGDWRTSKLVGLSVYNSSNEKIGDINELISGSDGKIDTVVIGVGGFLGMGEHAVGIAWDQVKFVHEPAKSASTATTTTTGAATRNGAAARDLPDHATVNMTKDQLKGLPAFKYAGDK
jgi:sporulation protein YlmC with PRC-barrel domain